MKRLALFILLAPLSASASEEFIAKGCGTSHQAAIARGTALAQKRCGGKVKQVSDWEYLGLANYCDLPRRNFNFGCVPVINTACYRAGFSCQ